MGRHGVAMICSTLAFVGFAAAAEAASLDVVRGEVLLSRGGGYATVKGATDLLLGDTVLSKPGSAARIVFADGCTVALSVGAVYRVGTMPPCKMHSAGPGASGATETPGDSAQAPPNNGGWGTQTTEDPKPNILPYVLGAAAIGGIVAVVASTGGSGGSGGAGNGPPGGIPGSP